MLFLSAVYPKNEYDRNIWVYKFGSLCGYMHVLFQQAACS